MIGREVPDTQRQIVLGGALRFADADGARPLRLPARAVVRQQVVEGGDGAPLDAPVEGLEGIMHPAAQEHLDRLHLRDLHPLDVPESVLTGASLVDGQPRVGVHRHARVPFGAHTTGAGLPSQAWGALSC